jgi:hypothetical protein
MWRMTLQATAGNRHFPVGRQESFRLDFMTCAAQGVPIQIQESGFVGSMRLMAIKTTLRHRLMPILPSKLLLIMAGIA